jgi:hypothetical protein
MRLMNDEVYCLALRYFNCHGCWHLVRRLSGNNGKKIRNTCFPPNDLWPAGLQEQGAQGSGDDFLKFHRQMVRNFKWILTQVPSSPAYPPWSKFPGFVTDLFDVENSNFRRTFESDLQHMIEQDSSDALGRFIEDGQGATMKDMSVHSKAHGLIGLYEAKLFGGAAKVADMGNFNSSALNEHFWGLHGGIDEIYAHWQRLHGEKPVQSALKPDEPMPMCDVCHAAQTSAPFWTLELEKYLERHALTTQA